MAMPATEDGPTFDTRAADAVRAWSSRTGATLIPLAELSGGTDARVYIAALDRPSDGYHEVIAKRCFPRKDGQFESERLVKARSSNRDFAAEHIAELAADPLAVGDGGTLLLQRIAGDAEVGEGYPEVQTLANALSDPSDWQRWPGNIEALAGSLLGAWNRDVERPTPIDAKTLIRSILGDYRLGPDGPIVAMVRDQQPEALNLAQEWLSVEGERAPQANPWALCSAASQFGAATVLQNWAGRIHGDPHPGNIMVPVNPGLRGKFWLIDLSRFRDDHPLPLDQTYLCLTILADRLKNADADEQAELVDLLVDPDAAPRVLAPDVTEIVSAFRRAARHRFRGRGISGAWENLNRLTLCVNGLILASRTSTPAYLRKWYWRLACRAAGELMAGSGRGRFPFPRTSLAYPIQEHEERSSRSNLNVTPIEPPRPTPTRPFRSQRSIVAAATAIVCLSIVGIGGLTYGLQSGGKPGGFELKVDANVDSLVINERYAKPGGFYVTDLRPADVPDPPDRINSCLNRYLWAHSPAIGGVDADTTLARISIKAQSKELWVTDASVHRDSGFLQPMRGTLLGCPGKGGNRPPHIIDVDLDSGGIAFFPEESTEPATMNVQIAPGGTETFLMSAHVAQAHLTWRLTLTIKDGSEEILVTIGPDGYVIGTGNEHPEQRKFETTAGFDSTMYQFLDGDWRPIQ
ncbi:hypothetical protein [Micromonospora sp. WMMC250]|uniref:hypothetical protein n=1 Tax=Micromonospora sp. WMMC250 TaxID=3014781 RepID=UPI0022B66C8A|nr:hypothetical protein [Micromonospora sp. WMMC250]MCZ7374032.1 hypothetical protein [Micromonospora sp. WMMC250]